MGRLTLTAAVFLFSFTLFTVKDMFWFTGGHAFASGPLADEFTIPVLTYHSIADHPHNAYVTTPAKFQEEMKYLNDHHYQTINLAQFSLLMEQKKAVKANLVLITFDDGYANAYQTAFPILQKYGFTAVAFVITDWLGGHDFMSWQQAGDLQLAGWDIMPHSRTHPQLPLLSPQRQFDEISGSRATIEEKLGSTANAFAYPYGHRSKTTMELLQKAGYSYAFSFDNGLTTSNQNPLSLKRLVISRSESMRQFIDQLHTRQAE